MAQPALDADKVKLFSFHLFTKLEGAITSGMVWLGDQLGLYALLANASGPLTTTEIAARAGLDERWIREWACNQAAAKVIDWAEDSNDQHGRFSLSPEAASVLADNNSPVCGLGMFSRLPNTMDMLRQLPESFRTGIGHDYDAHGPDGAAGIERSFAPWYSNYLLPVGLPALDGVVEKMVAGAKVADVGCGGGIAVAMMAEAFPKSTFAGYDISQHALIRARERLADSGARNAAFHDPRTSPLPDDHSLDFVTTFDCIHDMAHPQPVIEQIYRSLKPDGTWLLVDIKGRDTFAQNVAKNPMASLMYGISVMSCMNSALSEPGGAGLGTLGLPASKAKAMSEAAGFTRFRVLDVEHAVNAFYEIRR
jgi:2-polyprenyl-3-methyl-5-hydroxy-6-metoxy-1,4-benzoquinol methylase